MEQLFIKGRAIYPSCRRQEVSRADRKSIISVMAG
jgi:hypothetical protein